MKNIGKIESLQKIGHHKNYMELPAFERKRRNAFSNRIQKSRISDIQNIQEGSLILD